MAYYLQLELNSDTNPFQIDIEGAVPFNSEVENNGNDTFDWTEEGQISILKKGSYFINWLVAQQTGLALDGGNFAIQTLSDDENTIHSQGSTHLKMNSVSGFAILNIADNPVKFQIINISEHPATLSEDTKIKASIAIFGVDEVQGEKGEDGITPEIGDNGNWWIGDHDTGVTAQGADGKDGITGKDGQDGLPGPAGADGSPGEKGEPGAKGQDGLPGPTGAGGPPGEKGDLGPTGLQGVQGNTGPTGPPGITGSPGIDGATGPLGPTGPSAGPKGKRELQVQPAYKE